MKTQSPSPVIKVFESSLYRTNSCVLNLGDAVIVVDPTWLPEEIKAIRSYVDGILDGNPLYLFFTHSDFDHILGYGAFPEARVIASDRFAKNNRKGEIIKEIQEFDDRYYIVRPYGLDYPFTDFAINTDGQNMNIGGSELLFTLAPGHTYDGAMLIWPEAGIIVAGDYLSNIEFPFIYHSYEDYKHTLESLLKTISAIESINILIPGHGDIEAGRPEIMARIHKDLMYLDLLKQECQNPDLAAANVCREFIKSYSTNPFLIQEHERNMETFLKTFRP